MILLAAYALTAAYSLDLIWNHLNYLQMDLAGHMASGAWFQRGYFHQYQDANFLGYVHGLFYPPLEDLILAVLNWVFYSPEIAYRVYLSVLLIGFLGSIYWVAHGISNALTRNLVRLACLWVLWISKGDGLYFQGLSLTDLHVTGLSSEILGGVFFFLLLKEWLGKFRAPQLLAYLILCILSHIVVALVALLILASDFWFSQSRRKLLALVVGGALLVTSFYLAPFVAYKGYLTTAKIIGINVWPLSAIIAGFLIVLWRRPFSGGYSLLLVAMLLTLPTVLGGFVPSIEKLLPRFHYYRFVVFALYLAIIGVGYEVASIRLSEWRWKRMAPLILMGVVALIYANQRFSIFRPSVNSPTFQEVQMNLDGIGPTSFTEYGRYWVIGTQRSADFGLDSLLQVYDPNFRSAKGLYWESSRNNLMLSSYLATLLSSPVVLDHFFYWGYHCGLQRCLMDHFFRDYNIRGLMIEEDIRLPYISQTRRGCFKEFNEKPETDRYRLEKVGRFNVQGVNYTNYWISAKNQQPFSRANTNSAVELIDLQRLVPFRRGDASFFSYHIKSVFMSCQSGMMSDALFIEGTQYAEIQREAKALDAIAVDLKGLKSAPEFKRIDAGRFKISIPGDQDVLFRVKLNYYPFLRLFRADGSEVKLFDAFPSTLAIGHGELTLEFRKTWLMFASYIVSAIAALILVIFWRRLRSAVA